VGPMVVVVVEPGREGVKALLIEAIETGIGPFSLQGEIQPLDLAIGLGPIGPGALVVHSGPGHHLAEQPRAVAVAVIGQDPLDGDANRVEKSSARWVKPATVAAPSSGWTSKYATREQSSTARCRKS
jgi:hypothetical protein